MTPEEKCLAALRHCVVEVSYATALASFREEGPKTKSGEPLEVWIEHANIDGCRVRLYFKVEVELIGTICGVCDGDGDLRGDHPEECPQCLGTGLAV